ncbi:PREDICTED: copine-5 [Ficedula albicollis]|uniref:C2 domain-containing protein n=3 Tax=Passeriformes TaxID=9126 RepID=A0A803WBF3_FICAL|nr:PREDICTED: copine-5 [Ficedula albicollis]
MLLSPHILIFSHPQLHVHMFSCPYVSMSLCHHICMSPCPHSDVPLPPCPCPHPPSHAPVFLSCVPMSSYFHLHAPISLPFHVPYTLVPTSPPSHVPTCPCLCAPISLYPHPPMPMFSCSHVLYSHVPVPMSPCPCVHITTSPCHRPHPMFSCYPVIPAVHIPQFGRTEVIDNSLNPDFLHKFVLDYCFEERQNLRFDLYDVDSKTPDLSKHDFLGQAFCTLGEIVGSAGSRLEKPLMMGTATTHPRGRRPAPAASNGGIPGKKCGTIILLAEELGNCRDVATLQFCANKLDKKDFFGKSDPFMVFYRSNEDGTFTICHKTEVVRNTLNPVWAAFAIPVRALCNGDHDRAIKVEVYDWDRDGSHDFIGEFTTSYRELAQGQSHLNVYEVVNPRKKIKKKKYLNSGTVTLLSFAVEAEHTFLDYIRGGTQLNFTVAIDFTASNGNPSQPTSLHYLSPFQLNAYSLALRAVGDIIQDYDSDKMFPALGFGAKVPPDGRVSHEFPLNGDASNPACHGIAGVLEAYQRSLRRVQLYGPTNFAPVVNHVARSAATVLDGSQYFVLLIITDGVISDMAQTKEAIVNAAKLPMSIIIVGVGQAEFDAMVELDGDDIRISSRGKVAERDIVQFVPFRDYMSGGPGAGLSMAGLAREVLAEIPDQLLSYMKARGIKPPPIPPMSPETPPP